MIFQSTLPARGATERKAQLLAVPAHFNPRSPHGERPDYLCGLSDNPHDFNPRSPHGERRIWASSRSTSTHFNPRSPHGERRNRDGFHPCAYDFNPRSPHGERRAAQALPDAGAGISIHAPRTGSDPQTRKPTKGAAKISIHAPRTGSDAVERFYALSPAFQSTLPARGATSEGQKPHVIIFISIHAPRTGSDLMARRSRYTVFIISIHAPRTGSDEGALKPGSLVKRFQSTLPARGATRKRRENP